jgi:hypothetical protein
MPRNISLKCLAGLGLSAYSFQGGPPTKETFTLIAGDAMSMQFVLLREGETAIAGVSLSGLSAARVVIRADRDPTDTLLAFSDAYAHSSGSFAVTADLTVTTDRITFAAVALDGSALLSAVDAAGPQGLECWVEMSTTSSGGEDTWYVGQCTIYPDVYRTGSPGPDPAPDYLTEADTLALVELHYDSATNNLAATGTADCYTVPTGKAFLLSRLTRYVVSATSMTVAETITVGSDSDPDAACGATAMSKLAAGQCEAIHFADPVPFAAGDIVRVTKTVAATASAATGKYIIHGILISNT